jgi:hypothetical protein
MLGANEVMLEALGFLCGVGGAACLSTSLRMASAVAWGRNRIDEALSSRSRPRSIYSASM